MKPGEVKKVVKASFKDCLVADRKLFFKSHCIMPISVGQKVHEGEKFLATIKLINASFKECTILVDDSIQRHTMRIQSDQDEKTLYQLAIQEGNDWLGRNAATYESFDIPYKILRWDEWLEHPDYGEFHEKIKFHYENNRHYQEKIHENIEEFLIRYQKHSQPVTFSYQKAFSYCIDYLMEECAVMCLWAKAGYAFEVYPNGRNKAMAATHELLIQPVYPNLLKSVALRFKKYSVRSEEVVV